MKCQSKRCVAIAALGVCSSCAVAQTLPIVGSPEMDASSTGLRIVDAYGVSNAGLAVGDADMYISGTNTFRAPVQWSFSGVGGPLGTLGSDSGSTTLGSAFAINGSGLSVGYVSKATGGSAKGYRAVRWAAGDTTPVELDTPTSMTDGTAYAIASAISADGTIVGWSNHIASNTYTGNRAVRWTAGGAAAELATLGTPPGTSPTDTTAIGIDASGAAYGTGTKWVAGKQQGARAIRWVAGSTVPVELLPIDNPNPFGTPSSTFRAVNAGGTAVGISQNFINNVAKGNRAVRWHVGSSTPTVLGTTESSGNFYTTDNVTAINDSGTAVGESDIVQGNTNYGSRAVRWDANSTAATVLTGLGGNRDSLLDINSIGVAVGSSYIANDETAAIWKADGTSVNLNSIGTTTGQDGSLWYLSRATKISNTGFITGYGQFDPDGSGPRPSYQRGYVMLVPFAGTYGQGDADFNGKVSFSDLVILAQHYGQANPSLASNVGDFNLDGITNFADLVPLAQHYQASGAALTAMDALSASFKTDWALAQSLVPEPGATLCAIGTLVSGMTRRRRS